MTSSLRQRQIESLRNLGVPGTDAAAATRTNGRLDAQGRASRAAADRRVRAAGKTRSQTSLRAYPVGRLPGARRGR